MLETLRSERKPSEFEVGDGLRWRSPKNERKGLRFWQRSMHCDCMAKKSQRKELTDWSYVVLGFRVLVRIGGFGFWVLFRMRGYCSEVLHHAAGDGKEVG